MKNISYQLLIWDNRDRRMMDITDVTETVTWSTYVEDQPAKLKFTVNKAEGLAFWEGATVYFTVNTVKVFCGIVFKKERTEDVNTITVTAYDFMIYFKNKDTLAFVDRTLGGIVETVAKRLELDYAIIQQSDTRCIDRVFDTKSYMEMIQTSRDDILISTGEYYVIRANWQTIELRNSTSLVSNLLLGDNSGISAFNYTSDIEDTYNYVKLYRDNQDTGRREIYAVYDSDTIRSWGLLQYYASVSDTLNEAQIEERATSILGLYNKPYRQFKVTDCLGDLSVFAGSIIRVQIADLGDISLNDNLLIREATHEFKSSVHTMSFSAEVKRGA